MKRIIVLSTIALISVVGLTFYSCGGGTTYNDGGADGKTGTVYYEGAGSVMNVTLYNDTLKFDYSETATASEEMSFNISGTFERLASGFLKFTVTTINSCSGTSEQCPTVGTTAYGMEIPGMALLIKPSGDHRIKPVLVKGFCPTSTMEANWVKLRARAGVDPSVACTVSSDSADNWFGTFTYDPTAATASVPTSFDLAGYNSCPNNNPAFTSVNCVDGVVNITQSDSGKVNLYLTKNGGALVHVNPDTESQIIMGFPVQTITTASNLDGDYLGLVFSALNEDIKPINGTISGTSMSGYEVDPDTGTQTGSTVNFTIDSVDSPSAGFVKITATTMGNKKMACQAAPNGVGATANQKKIINCVSQDTTASYYFNLLLVQK